MRTFTTASGEVLTDEDIERIADEVATDEWVEEVIRRQRGRPRLGSEPSTTVRVRLDEHLDGLLRDRATADDTTVSEVVRSALRQYLAAS